PVAFRSSPPVLRTFCGKCGTPLTYQHDDSLSTIDVTTSTLDSPERFAPTREIWIEHKLSWEALNGSLEHFPRGSAEK
ncbi:MAG: GFA family protein, partial [Betaproteobacteria bacterium]